MTRADRRKGISPIRLHSKAFEKSSLKEITLDDWSIQFSLEWFASTVDKDYDGDVIMPEGIDTKRYMDNPIIKAQHGRGLWTNIWLTTSIDIQTGKGVYITCNVILNPDIQEHKTIIHWLRHGLINWFSIGFGNIKMKYDDTLKANVISSLELHEISLVDIPNNPMTVRKMLEVAKDLENETDEDLEDTNWDDQSDTIDNENWDQGEDSKDNNNIEDDVIDNNDPSDPIDNPSDNQSDLKSLIKKAILWDWELPVIGNMYRVKILETYEWSDWYTSCRENIYNAECIKITSETEEDGAIKYEVFWLIYQMEFDGREPTTWVVKSDLENTTIMDLSDEQLKELINNKTKDLDVKEDETADDNSEADEIVSDEPKNIDWQDDAEIWNEEGDQGVQDDAEIIDWNVGDDQDESHKSLDGWEDKELIISDLSKSLEIANSIIVEKDKTISQQNDDIELASKTITDLVDQNDKLSDTIKKFNDNFIKMGNLYKNVDSVDEPKEHPLAKRVRLP